MTLALLLLVIIVCVALLAILAHVLLYPHIRTRKSIKLKDLPTGSLVFTGIISKKYVMNLASINTNHAMMVINNGNGDIKLVEISNYNRGDPKECHAYLVDARTYLADNRIYAMCRKYSGPKISTDAVKSGMQKLSFHHIYLGYSKDFMYYNFGNTRDTRDPDTPGISCAEYIYKLKCELGISTLDRKMFTDAYKHLENDDPLYSKLSDLIME